MPIRLATRPCYLRGRVRIICPVSESYESKRERRQRTLEALPVELRTQASLRNAESVASLTPQAQQRLAEAIRAGLKRLPRAVEQLRVNPDASVAELLRPHAHHAPEKSPAHADNLQGELADLIQRCFPDMPRLSAEALAGAEVMDMARQTAYVHQLLFESNHLRTDFVMVVLYALVRETLEHLEEIIADTPALAQALRQSRLPLKFNDWRKQDAQTNR